jgi:glycosyltransferase involved in cell wall biosynthesis
LNILFLADAVFKDKPGGSRMAAHELAVRLVDLRHRVTFLVGRQEPSSPSDEWNGKFRIIRYPGAGNATAYIREGKAACLQLLSGEKFDVAHTHFAYSAKGPIAVLPNDVAKVRTFHGPWDEEGWVEEVSSSTGLVGRLKATIKRRLRYRVELESLRASQRIIVLSECFRKDVVERFGIDAAKVIRVPGGADTVRFKPVPDRLSARAELNVPLDRPILFTVRRLAARMGIDNLILALPEVAKLYPNVLLLVGGKGPAREYLESLVQLNGLTNNVRFLGFISDAQLPRYYQAADLFVLPTIALEGFGLVTAEALASGTPVLGTPVGATPELLAPIDYRLIASGITPAALAEGVKNCLSCIREGAWPSDMLASYAREQFDWDRNALATQTIYESAISELKATTASK